MALKFLAANLPMPVDFEGLDEDSIGHLPYLCAPLYRAPFGDSCNAGKAE
jgi:hypothetical protein